MKIRCSILRRTGEDGQAIRPCVEGKMRGIKMSERFGALAKLAALAVRYKA